MCDFAAVEDYRQVVFEFKSDKTEIETAYTDSFKSKGSRNIRFVSSIEVRK